MGTKTSFTTSFFNINQRYVGTSYQQSAFGGNLRLGTPLWDERVRLFYGPTLVGASTSRLLRRRRTLRRGLPLDGVEPFLTWSDSACLPGVIRFRAAPVTASRPDLAGDPGRDGGVHRYELERLVVAHTINDRTVLNLSLKTGGSMPRGFVLMTDSTSSVGCNIRQGAARLSGEPGGRPHTVISSSATRMARPMTAAMPSLLHRGALYQVHGYDLHVGFSMPAACGMASATSRSPI